MSDQLKHAAHMAVAEMRNRFDDPTECEICGCHRSRKDRPLLGHHWKGYEYPYEVWWVCDSCHSRLRLAGIDHNGQTTLREARMKVVTRLDEQAL